MPKRTIDTGDRNLTLQFLERCARNAPEVPLPQILSIAVHGFRETYASVSEAAPTTVGELYEILNQLDNEGRRPPQIVELLNACHEALPALTLECKERGIDLTGILKIEATAGQIRTKLYRERCVEALQICVTLPIVDRLMPLIGDGDPMMSNITMILICLGTLVGLSSTFTYQLFDQREAEANDEEIAPIVARFNEWVDYVISGREQGVELTPRAVKFMLRELKQLERRTDPKEIEENGHNSRRWRETRPDLLIGQNLLPDLIDRTVPKGWLFERERATV